MPVYVRACVCVCVCVCVGGWVGGWMGGWWMGLVDGVGGCGCAFLPSVHVLVFEYVVNECTCRVRVER